MTELTDLSDTDALNTEVTSQSTEGNVANMGNMDNLFQATLGMLSRFRNANIFRLRDNTDKTKLLAFDLSGLTTATTRTLTVPDADGTLAFMSDIAASVTPVNLSISASVASNALTIALKGHDGNDPSASNVVYIPFRSATASSGDVDIISITAATSLVISSGSTMGFTSATAGRLWIVGFNDGGTFRLGAVNCLSGVNIMALRDGIYSSTAEGGGGGADSAQVIYTDIAVTSKALTILGYIEATEAIAGTWSTAPSAVKVLSMGDSLPGEVVQRRRTVFSGVATGATTVPLDGSIPQITEGDQYMTQAITPSSAANVLSVTAQATMSSTGSSAFWGTSIFRDATASALASALDFETTTGGAVRPNVSVDVFAASTSSTTFRLRSGTNVAATSTFNGLAGVSYYVVMNSYMQVEEIMA